MVNEKINVSMIGFRTTAESYPLGGIEQWISSVVSRLSNNIDVTLFVRKKYHVKQIDYANTVIIKGIYTKNLETISTSFFATIQALKTDSIIHYHGNLSAIWAFLPFLFKKKVVTTLHGKDWERDKWGFFMKFIHRLALLISVKYSNVIVSCSEQLALDLTANHKKKIRFIPNGCESNLPYNCENNELSQKKYLLYLGRIVPEKNIHLLIEEFNNSKVDCELFIAGSAPYMDSYSKKLKEKSKANSRIKFLGPVEGTFKWQLIKYSHALCSVSSIEGMSLSILEAISLNKTCILSNIEENLFFKKIITNNEGLHYFSLDKPGDLSSCIKKVINNQIHKSKYDNLEYFNWSRVAKDYCQIYMEVSQNDIR